MSGKINLNLNKIKQTGVDGVIIQFDNWVYTPISGDAGMIINTFMLDLQESKDLEMYVYNYEKALQIKEFLIAHKDSLLNALEGLEDTNVVGGVVDFDVILEKAIANIENAVKRYGAYLVFETDINY